MRSGRRQERPPPRSPEPCPLCGPHSAAQSEHSGRKWAGVVTTSHPNSRRGWGGGAYSGRGPSLRMPAAWGTPSLPACRAGCRPHMRPHAGTELCTAVLSQGELLCCYCCRT